MGDRKPNGSVEHHRVRWVRDESGVAHAVRQSEGEHCSAYCRRYVKGEWFVVVHGDSVRDKCRWCCDKLDHPIALSSGPPIPRVVLLGHGVQDELRRRAKGRD